MKKVRLFSMMLVVAAMLSLLAGCACKHEWKDANCKDPKTCSICGATEGEKNEAHQWQDATTEAPKTCTVCGKTEGERIQVDSRFKTVNCKEVFGTWEGKYDMDASKLGLANLVIPMKLTMSFSNDGKMEMRTELYDPDAFEKDFIDYLKDLMYGQFAAAGMNQEQADAACQAQYGMDVTAYCTQQAQQGLRSMTTIVKMVYYVDDGKIYVAEDWDEKMDPDNYEMKDGKLMLDDKDLGQIVAFTKVS